MTSKVTFHFKIEHYNGTMGLRIESGESVLFQQDKFDQEALELTFDILFPTELTLHLYNKGPMDTQVDDQGNILKDKCIKIEKMFVDRMQVYPQMFSQIFKLQHENGVSMGSYFGFNGICKIPFQEQNSFKWHLARIAEFQ